MRLLLAQHAEAFAKAQYPDRPLTEYGALQVMQVTEFLKPLDLAVDAVWHSGKTRALQTAKVLCKAVRCPRDITAQDGLGPDDDPAPIAAQIEQAGKDLMIVGHLPFLEILAALLLTGRPSPAPVKFQKAAVLCLEQGEQSSWHVAWMITPALLEAARTPIRSCI